MNRRASQNASFVFFSRRRDVLFGGTWRPMYLTHRATNSSLRLRQEGFLPRLSVFVMDSPKIPVLKSRIGRGSSRGPFWYQSCVRFTTYVVSWSTSKQLIHALLIMVANNYAIAHKWCQSRIAENVVMADNLKCTGPSGRSAGSENRASDEVWVPGLARKGPKKSTIGSDERMGVLLTPLEYLRLTHELERRIPTVAGLVAAGSPIVKRRLTGRHKIAREVVRSAYLAGRNVIKEKIIHAMREFAFAQAQSELLRNETGSFGSRLARLHNDSVRELRLEVAAQVMERRRIERAIHRCSAPIENTTDLAQLVPERVLKAESWFRYAQQRSHGSIAPDKSGEEDAFGYLREHGDEDGSRPKYSLVAFRSYLRQGRTIRRQTPLRRGVRPQGRSMARIGEIDYKYE